MPAGSASSLNGARCVGVEPPADAALGDPALDPREIVVVEVEAAPDRLAVGEVEHLRRRDPLARELDEPGDDAEHRVRLAQRAVGEPHAQVGRADVVGQRVGLVLVGRHLARAERRLDERRERLDVRAHDDHVARLERRVVLEQVQDRVAEDLDLARAPVAGVDLDAAIVGSEPGARRACRAAAAGRLAVRADVGLDAAQQRVGACATGWWCSTCSRRAEHELHLARVAAPGRQQRG